MFHGEAFYDLISYVEHFDAGLIGFCRRGLACFKIYFTSLCSPCAVEYFFS